MDLDQIEIFNQDGNDGETQGGNNQGNQEDRANRLRDRDEVEDEDEDEEEEERRVRRRLVLSYEPPYRQGVLPGNRIPPTYARVTLAQLMAFGTRRTNRTYIHLQLIRIVPSNSESGKNQGSYSYYNKLRRDTKQNASYVRMFLFRELGTSSVCYIVEDASQKRLWNRELNLRDSGEVTIGTIIAIANPSPIVNFIGNDSPILSCSLPALVLSYPNAFREVPIQEVSSNQTKAFTLTNVGIRLNFVSVESSCSGFFCDRQNCTALVKNNKKCGCYTLLSRNSNVVFNFDLSIFNRLSQEELFTVENFSSFQFMKMFLNGTFPSNVQLSTLQELGNIDLIQEAIERCLTTINDRCGFTIFGWYKRGEINDQGNSESDQAVEAGHTAIHLVHAIITETETFNLPQDQKLNVQDIVTI